MSDENVRSPLIFLLVLVLALGATADADGSLSGYEPPRVLTQKAFGVEPTYAVVTGLARHDQGLPVYWRFKWGLAKDSYEHVTEASEGYVLNGMRPVGFEELIRPLKPDTIYHYRAIGFTAAGKAVGQDRRFHTPPANRARRAG